MKDFLSEWNKEVNYSLSKKKKINWKDKNYRAVWTTGLELKGLSVLHSTRRTLKNAENYIKNNRKNIWKNEYFWIEIKENGKWIKFKDC